MVLRQPGLRSRDGEGVLAGRNELSDQQMSFTHVAGSK